MPPPTVNLLRTPELGYTVQDGRGRVLARVIHVGAMLTGADRGTTFLTQPEEHLQVGALLHPAGRVIRPHVHRPFPRKVDVTSEVLLILSGSMRVDLYSDDWEVQSIVVDRGDMLVLLSGGHGFTVLEDLEALEIKQGPHQVTEKVYIDDVTRY